MRPESRPRFQLSDFEGWTIQSINEAVSRQDPDKLLLIPIVITLHGSTEPLWSEEICLSLAKHSHPNVRGNAILGFGHLSRTEGLSNQDACTTVIRAGLNDESPYVQGHAVSAADDVEQSLGWRIRHTDRG